MDTLNILECTVYLQLQKNYLILNFESAEIEKSQPTVKSTSAFLTNIHNL